MADDYVSVDIPWQC